MRASLEVHEHCIVGGPRTNIGGRNRVIHSHEGGDVPHEHPDTGPASFTIDKDEWRRRTGMTGGGRKKFTARPTGEQLPLVAIDPADLEYEVIVSESALKAFREFDPKSQGPGLAIVDRLDLALGLKPRLRVVR